MLSCKDAACLASEGLDRKLPFWRRLALSFHLLICSNCRLFVRKLLFLRDICRRFDYHDSQWHGDPAGLSAEARKRHAKCS